MAENKEVVLTNWERLVCFQVAASQGGTAGEIRRWWPILDILEEDAPWDTEGENVAVLKAEDFDGESTLSLSGNQYDMLKRGIAQFRGWNSGGQMDGHRRRTEALFDKFGV